MTIGLHPASRHQPASVRTSLFLFFLGMMVTLLVPAQEAEGQGYVMLAGGGAESAASGSWSNEPYGWFAQRATAVGEGRIVVLSNSDTSVWLPNYFTNLGATEVVNLTITGNTEAQILAALNGAGGVFLKGGDQRHYIDAWRGGAVEAAIRAVFDSGGVIGGTSAGAMVAGAYFTRGGTTSSQLLRNPWAGQDTMQENFLDLLPNTIIDTHYFERGRPGRLLSKMAFIVTEMGASGITGVGIDDKTAVMIFPDGRLRVSGTGGVHVLRSTPQTVFDAQPNQDLGLTGLAAHQLTHGFEIGLETGELLAQPDDAQTVEAFTGTGPDLTMHFRRTAWNSTYLNARADDSLRILLDSGEVSTNALLSHSVPVEVVPFDETLTEDPAWLESLFAGDRLFLNISPEEWLQLSSSEPFRMLTDGASTELELLTRHLPVMGEGYATNLTANGFIAYDGRMTVRPGSGFLPGTISVDSTYANQTFAENFASAPGWLMHSYQAHVALSGTRFTQLSYERGELRFDNTQVSTIIMDAREGYLTSASPFVASNASNRTRNSAAVSHGLMHVIPAGGSWQLYETEPVSIPAPAPELPAGFAIERVYPNPFNPATTILIRAESAADGFIEVFNVAGQRVYSRNLLLQQGMTPHSLNLSHQSSGVYLVRVTASGTTQQARITLVR
ncbi:cyanophycinase [Cyclonatronum proteinivorum]|uniref:Cyanophycinase n=2 Tax=Cyclonatronum proteinivorum TaxID=1457365 RepID=A0A345UHE1_9BACT|nr:cyanophycinase [Cyclonatronum proteinivorum]